MERISWRKREKKRSNLSIHIEIYDGDSVLIVKVNSNESRENEQRSGNYEN